MKYLIIILASSIICSSCNPKDQWMDLNNNGKLDNYEDTSLTLNERVSDLILRMTLVEKISQLNGSSPAIKRLGIEAYVWRNEALHGVMANTGPSGRDCDSCINKTTVFPQSIGLASTWNPDLAFQEAIAISDEARALANSIGNQKYLNFWNPMINIARDPRWGRTQEGYGEDPFLVSKIAVQYIRGLQGEDDTYVKVIASPKHFIANNVDGDRHFTSSNIEEKILRDYYFPAFKSSITEANALGIMSAYNALNGVPCSSNEFLLTEVLRKEWGFDGHVVSDCGAIYNIHANHLFVKTPEEGVAKSILSGTDMNCGGQYGKYLLKAINSDLLTEDELDISLRRVLLSRFKLGMFDPQELVPYSKIQQEVIDSEKHRVLAKKVALESIVLLKNKNKFLPLNKDIKSIAVIGPNADSALFGNYSGLPSYGVTPFDGIKAKVSEETIVRYAQGAPIFQKNSLPPLTSDCLITPDGGKGLKCEFFNNMDFIGEPAYVRTDTLMVHQWLNENLFPSSFVRTDQFSVRWTGKIAPKVTGKYMFNARTTVRSSKKDKGIRIYIDDELVVDQWTSLRHWDSGISKQLIKGKLYEFRVEYVDDIDWAAVTIGWKPINASLLDDAKSLAKNSDVVILVLGSNNATEEELHDRTSIDLIDEQKKLVKEIYNLNQNILIVLINGSPISINWENDNIPAILEAWYPGQEGGNAIADIIFGDYNPGGKLPITFYKNLEQLPDFYDYDITKGRTYMFLDEDPLYPFGHGLSYTEFDFRNFYISDRELSIEDSISVSFDLFNVGDYQGSEVVQVYIKSNVSSKYIPNKQLKSFKKIFLKSGQSMNVVLQIPVKDLETYSVDYGEFIVESGIYNVLVGNSSENILLNKSISIIN